MTYEDEFSIILNSIAKLSSLGFKKWFANMDEIDDEKSNLRILGICHNELIKLMIIFCPLKNVNLY